MSTKTYTRLLRGKVQLAEIDANGNVGPYFWAGNVESGALTISEEKLVMDETFSRQMGEYKTTTVKTTVDIALSGYEFTPEMLAIGMRANLEEVPASTGNNQTSPTTLEVGKIWALEKQNVSNVVIVDSSSTPLSLAEGVDYQLNAKYGSVVVTSTKNLTMPLKATYDAGVVQRLVFNSADKKEYAIRFEAENVSESGQAIMYEIYRSDLDLAETFNMIDTEYAKLDLKGKALVHPAKERVWQQILIND